jgi:hypothetical protein
MSRFVRLGGLGSLRVLALFFVFVAGCGDAGALPSDSGVPGNDSAPIDAASTAADAGPQPYDSGPTTPCETAGAIETVACGMCGSVQRFCGADHTWSYGECAGEGGECTPGTTQAIACGMCGTQQAQCGASCTWTTLGACEGEGTCAPGTRTRSDVGCAAGETRDVVCSDACVYEPAGMCVSDGCMAPGTLETVACGMCGHQDRFCNASHAWEYSTCTGEGVCLPGTAGSSSCGMCGTQTTHCTEACVWSAFGSCSGEGTCVLGTTTRTSAGCPAGQMQTLQCDASCGYSIIASACAASAVDVVLLLDQTGSNLGDVTAMLPTLRTRLIAPLLGMTGVEVGIAYSGEFPIAPYGYDGDRPFEGGIEPGTSLSAIDTELASRPALSGGDSGDATVEALSVLAGGPLASSSIAMVCSSGGGGGCWRSGARRVVVIFTDSEIHEGPDPATAGALYLPYSGISPAPATWTSVRSALLASGTLLFWIDANAPATASAQFDVTLRELGQPTSDHTHAGTPGGAVDATQTGTACDAIVLRIASLAT